uniref:UGGT thioredoxin-like domain-containing protein n=1 Tax=Parascaris equorum TaxID=6256 RepID=A0A914RA00_PAREQ
MKSRSHETTVIIYGELGSKTWLSLHLAAKKLAKNKKAKYVFRHWSKEARDDKVLLSGYGFNTLNLKLYSDSKESLDQFRLHLLEKDELTPLKVWQVQDLSYQASQRIVSATPEKVQANQELTLSELGIAEGDSALLINGISVDVDPLDKEYLTILLNIEQTDDRSSYALDFRNAFPEYLNNLDTNSQYRQWGNSVKLILGVVFVVNDDKSLSGFEDASVAMLNYYNFVKIDQNVPKAIHALV